MHVAKYLRLYLYSFVPTQVLLEKLCKLSRTERELIRKSNLVEKRDITINVEMPTMNDVGFYLDLSKHLTLKINEITDRHELKRVIKSIPVNFRDNFHISMIIETHHDLNKLNNLFGKLRLSLDTFKILDFKTNDCEIPVKQVLTHIINQTRHVFLKKIWFSID